ncbi:MAG: hypothetical protein Q8862_09250 [Bacteroidota bacterium]|nr:hypothetical protein [Bacteroidota bacterium]
MASLEKSNYERAILGITPIVYNRMKNKFILLILLILILKINGFGQTEQIPKDTIASRFLKGDMIIINNWALAGPIDFFDTATILQNPYKAELLDAGSAKVNYGFFGNKIRIYELLIPSIDSIPNGYLIDAKILKYLNPEKEIFYFINGAPCKNYSDALDMIMNKKIVNIQQLGVDQATRN